MDRVITFDEAEGFLKKKLRKLLAQTSTNSTHYANTSCKHWSNLYARKARSTDGLALQWIQMFTHFWNQMRSQLLSIQAPLFAAPATLDMTDAIFKWNNNYSTSFVNISQACFQMLNESISNKSKVLNTPNLTGWNSSILVQDIPNQLEASYGKLDTMTLFANNTLFWGAFPPTDSPEMLFYRIKQCQEIQTLAQDPYSATKIINNAVWLWMQSNIFPLKDINTLMIQ